MALKPTIYKLRIDLSDINRDRYQTLSLTMALHPSETLERMMVRMLAYCINAEDNLTFSRGLSTPEEPDLWIRNLEGGIDLWIDVGEPAAERIKKASRLAKHVLVYSFNSKSLTWWSQQQSNFTRLPVSVYQFQWQEIQALAALAGRTMDFAVNLSGDTAYVATQAGECEVNWDCLQSAE